MIQNRRLQILLSLLIAVGTFAIYSQVLSHGFVNIDDHLYVTENVHVKNGLTLKGILWAFTTIHAEFWHPLTWLSLMLDTQFFGVTPSGYLFTNLILHICNSLILFLTLYRMTLNGWRSAFVAALFAIHPLHVESVAWISERKDVLCAFFGLLAMWNYAHSVHKNGAFRYLWVHVFFVLGLMAKPMIVTLPALLLLFDFWPLERIQLNDQRDVFWERMLSLVREKTFLFAIAAIEGVVTIIVQQRAGGLASIGEYGIVERLINALTSYLAYISRMFWPKNLAVFYPFPSHFSVWKITVSLAVMSALSVVAILSVKRRPFIIVGWLWFIISLLPVIGLIKIGDFANADRYTYLPLIGLFIIIAWGVPVLLSSWSYKNFFLFGSSTIILASFAAATSAQIAVWSNSQRLFEHALHATGSNFYVHHSLGNIYASQKRFEKAISHFTQAVKLNDKKQQLKNSLARALLFTGRFEEAKQYLLEAIHQAPEYSDPHYILGLVLMAQGHYREALDQFAAAVRLSDFYMSNRRRQEFLHALVDLAEDYKQKGQIEKALSLYGINPSVNWLKSAGAKGFQNWSIFRKDELENRN
jgi:hypothetical protein